MNAPVWIPAHPEQSRMYAFMRAVETRFAVHLPDYPALYAWSVQHPERFWPAVAHFFTLPFTPSPETVLTPYTHPLEARWFTDVRFNFAHVLLSGKDDDTALISLHETGQRDTLSYAALRRAVAACRQGLKEAGVTAGCRVAAVLPNTGETVIAMLAAASLGATWASCSPDFGLEALLDRFSQIAPDVVFITESYNYMGKMHDQGTKITALRAALPSVKQWVICAHQHYPLQHPACVAWKDFVVPGTLPEYTLLPFAHPLYILFSSGTTGKPKCLVHSAGGTLLQHVKELGLHTDISSEDTLFFYTTCGWMMWNWMVSVLALGATLILYDGAPTYPHALQLFDIVEAEKVTVFGTSARFLSHSEKETELPCTKRSFQALKTLLSTGSPLLPEQYDFIHHALRQGIQICSISGGTDIVSCFALGNPLLPVYRGELQCRGLGMAVEVFNEKGQSVEGSRGELVCTQPFPSMPAGFWNDPAKIAYRKAYFDRFPGVWTQGDFAEITPHGGLIIYGRSDAILNPGGVRIGTAEIYRQLAGIPEILDSVAIGQPWKGDVRIVLFVTLRTGVILNEALRTTIRTTLRQHASPRHVPGIILETRDIPKTLNGKTAEIAVRQTVQGETVENTHVLANPEALAYFKNRKELQ